MKGDEGSPFLQLLQQRMNYPYQISWFCNLTDPFSKNVFVLLDAYDHGHESLRRS